LASVFDLAIHRYVRFLVFFRTELRTVVFSGRKEVMVMDPLSTILLILLTVPMAVESLLEIYNRRRK
jgi:hypothetical protein